MEKLRLGNNTSEMENIPNKEYIDTLSNDDILNDKYDPNKLTKTADDFHMSDNYSIIDKQQFSTDRKVNNGPWEEQWERRSGNMNEIAYYMVGYTRVLINKICGIKETGDKPDLPDEIVYLDKSARPVSWLVNIFWDRLAPRDANGNIYKRPHHSYVNIDRIAIMCRLFGMEPSGREGVKTKDGIIYDYASEAWKEYKEKLTPEHIATFRSLFLEDGIPKDNMTAEEIMELHSSLDGKKIYIVDEVSSGKATTIDMAKTLFQKAFKDCTVNSSVYWPDDCTKNVPIWYNRDSVYGRGTGDIDPVLYKDTYESMKEQYEKGEIEESALRRARAKHYGSLFLSATVKLEQEPGNLSRRLLADFKQLYKDYCSNNIFPYLDPANDDQYIIDLVRQGINPMNSAKIKTQLFSKE